MPKFIPDVASANIIQAIALGLKAFADVVLQAAVECREETSHAPANPVVAGEATAEAEAATDSATAPTGKRGPGRPRKSAPVQPDTSPERAAGLTPEAPTPPAVELPPPAPTMGYETAKPILLKTLEIAGEAAFRALLKGHGVASARELAPEALPAFVEACKLLMVPPPTPAPVSLL